MALVKKGPFFMAFYGHKTLIIISYHFYGFLWLRSNPGYDKCFLYLHSCLKAMQNNTQMTASHRQLIMMLMKTVIFLINHMNFVFVRNK